MTATKSAKKLILAIRQTIAKKAGEPASRYEVARNVGVSETSIKNWESGRFQITDTSLTKLEETLARLGGAFKAPGLPSEIAPKGKHAAKRADGGLKALLGDLAPPSKSRAKKAKKKHGTPIWTNFKIPNEQAERKKLSQFIASVGIKQVSTASHVLCDNGNVYWQFVAEFPPEAMNKIIKEMNEHNRQVTAERAKQYALDMVSDNWGWTGEPLLFSDKGQLMNGQNRLLAGRAFGKPIMFAVGFGAPPEAILFMDRQKVRGNRQQGQAVGWSYNHSRTLTIGLLHRYEKSKDGSVDLLEKVAPGSVIGGARHDELNRTYLEELDPALEFIHGLRWGIGRRALPKHIGVFMFMLMSRQAPDVARYFMLSLADGTHAMPGSPIYALRYKLTKLVADRTSEPGRYKSLVREQIGHGDTDAQVARSTEAIIMRNIAGAWSSFCAGKKNSSGKFNTGSDATTTAIINDMTKPCPKAIKEAQAFTPEALQAILERSSNVRDVEAKKAHDMNRDEGDVKHTAIKKVLETA